MAIKLPKDITQFELDKTMGVNLNDLVPDFQAVQPVGNKASAQNMSAYSAVLGSTDPNDTINAYMQMNNEHTLIGQSPTQTQIMGNVVRSVQADNQPNLMSNLADPSISDDEKQKMIDSYYNPTSPVYAPNNILSVKALETPVQNPNNEEDNLRIGIGLVSQRMNKYKQTLQETLNRNLLLNNPDTKESFIDAVDSLIPGAGLVMKTKVAQGLDPDHAFKTFAQTWFKLPGQIKQRLIDNLANATPDQLQTVAQATASAINNTSSILSNSPNYDANRQYLQDVLGGQYTTSQQRIENIGGALDLAGIIAPAGELAPIGKIAKVEPDIAAAFKADFEEATKGGYDGSFGGGNTSGAPNIPGGSGGASKALPSPEKATTFGTPEATVSNVDRDAIVSHVQPTTVSQNLKDTNPDIARQVHNSADVDSTGGEVAQAMYGTDRVDAMVNDLSPEMAHADGSVKSKVTDIDSLSQKDSMIDPELRDFVAHDGLSHFTQGEIARTTAWKINNFDSALGMNPRPEMFQIVSDGAKDVDSTGVHIRGMYGPGDHGYSDAAQAMELAKYALKDTAIPDSDITLYKRVGGSYVPTTLEVEQAASGSSFENATVDVKGKKYTLKGKIVGNSRTIEAFDQNGKKVGSTQYVQDGDGLDNPDTKVAKSAQRQGIATAMYDHAEKHGMVFPDAEDQTLMRTDSGNAFRAARASGKKPLVSYGGGDYLIGIDHHYKVNAADVKAAGAYENLDVKRNYLDRAHVTDGRQGTFANILLSKGSMLHPTIMKGALVASDKSKYLEKILLKSIHDDFAAPFNKLTPDRKQILVDYIQDNNAKSVAPKYSTMRALGMTNDEMKIMGGFQKVQDTSYYLRNQLAVKHLSNLGYEEYIHTGAKTNLAVRRVRNPSDNTLQVYDAMTDTNQPMSKADRDLLYKNGGTLAEPYQQFLDSAGNPVTHLKTGAGHTDGYLSKFTTSSTVLNYRPGYYDVQYKDRHIIMEQHLDKNGKQYAENAVATAPSMKAAKLHVDRMNATQNGQSRFVYRDSRSEKTNAERVATDYQTAVAQGHSSFRRRGKRLEDTNSQVTNISHLHIRSPVETMIRNAVSLSKKIANADPIAAMSNRAISQYGQYFPQVNGHAVIPGDIREVKYRGIGNQNSSSIADARTTVDYINYLRNGSRLNLLDDSTKAAMRNVADYMGAKGLAKAEGLFHGLSDKSLSGTLKKSAYAAFLALNPIRQFIVQGAQVATLTAINPSWMAGKWLPQMTYMAMRQMGMEANNPLLKTLVKGFGMNADLKYADDVWKSFNRAGISSAIDQQGMITGVLSDLAGRMISDSRSIAGKPWKAVKKIGHGARVVGFDAGEWVNSAASWMAHRDLAFKAGQNLNDPRVLDNITALSRNFTGSMNHAGDQPYNQNSLSSVFQFAQMTQKMGELLIGTNRMLNEEFKSSENLYKKTPTGGRYIGATLAILLLGLYGMPEDITWSPQLDNVLPNDGTDPNYNDKRQALSDGLVGWSLNHLMEAASGERVRMDWAGSLSPFNVSGTNQLLKNLFTSDLGTLISTSPSGSLFFGKNPRVLNFLKSAARFTNLIDDYAIPTQFGEVANNFAKIASGYSNYTIAYYAFKYGQKISGLGKVTDYNVSTPEAWLALAGVKTSDENRSFIVNNAFYATKTQKEADFNRYYNDYKQHLQYQYPNEDAFDFANRVMSEFNRVYGDDPTYRDWMNKKLAQDVADGDASVYNAFIRMSSLYGTKDIHSKINEYPFKSEKDREDLRARIDGFKLTDPTEK